MLLPDVMKRADDAALQQRDEAFRRVRVDLAAHELAAPVIDRLALHARDLLLALHADAAADLRLVHQGRARFHEPDPPVAGIAHPANSAEANVAAANAEAKVRYACKLLDSFVRHGRIARIFA